ncbi:RNA polymerase, sigma-24 subunit, ECF subfamily [Sporocytophaga myxococcoides]|uniref:RNA polymerase, sigma-24 subunit, ECF subfamily n=1 Tax=Sporocytophaga myxococcoides TaxID=153721 RepID=A0A098LP17_9BACT|nr:RNA polymerase sigma factor [Sporocytophaga myxococcoides]GAL87763.1 RNA polymerase, sigma-24 subunit, ECF subfamily [Sporocytophaga myxococcoides]
MNTVEFNNLVYIASKSLKYPALKFTHNQADANDLIQDTILKALKNKTKFKKGTNIKAWLYIIMKNTFISNYHKIDKRNSLVDPIDDDYTLNVPSTITYNDGTANVAMEEINKAINSLDKVFREPFMMHFSGFKYEEIAQKLKIPMGTVKNRIHVARKTLMSALKDYKI